MNATIIGLIAPISVAKAVISVIKVSVSIELASYSYVFADCAENPQRQVVFLWVRFFTGIHFGEYHC